jgi:hypothetical protein
VENYVIKLDKYFEFFAFAKKFEAYMHDHKDLFKEVKSHKFFMHSIGGKMGGFVEMTEFENLADLEKWQNKLMQSDFVTTIFPEFASFQVAGTYSTAIWNPVP